jgi:predicted MPP superfamily phosphohydrolase
MTPRGRAYTAQRAAVERILQVLYAGDWPARLWAQVPGATTVQVRRAQLPLLPPGTPPLRLGFASDLHLGPTTPPALLRAAAEALAEARLDLLLMGGDYVFLDANPTKARALADWAAAIPARLGRFAVWGNHDLWTRHDLLEEALSAIGVRWLVNEGLRLPDPYGDIGLFGLDDPWTGAPDPAAALAPLSGCAVRIGLAHAPDALPLLPPGAASVLLCGHTHGGQLALPGGRPLYVPGHAGQRWPWGRHEVEGTTLLVSRGLGGVEIPMRAHAPPDVWVVDLHARA